MISEHLGTARLYGEVRTAIEDMNQYLDSDALRRQGETMVRLTVVTTFGLIGITAMSFFGMNLIAAADSPLIEKLLYFLLVFIPSTAITLYTVLKSRGLADFLEALADDRMPASGKLAAFLSVWRKPRIQRAP